MTLDLNQRACDTLVGMWEEKDFYVVTRESFYRLLEVLGDPEKSWRSLPSPIFPTEEEDRPVRGEVMFYGGFGFFIQVQRNLIGSLSKVEIQERYIVYKSNRGVWYHFLETVNLIGGPLGRFKTLEEAKKFCILEKLKEVSHVS